MLVSLGKYVIKAVPDGPAGAITRALAGWITPVPMLPAEQDAMKRAVRLHYGERRRNAAWTWGSGPVVLLVHGWGGRAAQMAPLAEHISALGFHSVALDVTAHGDSPGRRGRWEYFIRDIAALWGSLGDEVFACVGHSAGALTMMAARRLAGLSASRYVCVCAPSHPFPPIEAVRRRLAPRPSVLEGYKDYIARQFGTTWAELQAGWAFEGAGADTLLFYDEMDRFIDHREGDRIKGIRSGATLVKTRAYGHRKILAAPELASIIGEFLTSSRKGAGAHEMVRH
jgi:pimeloyl-ACP methyl ester carboxylesterase